MVVKLPKNSPSLVDLREKRNVKRYAIPKKTYIIAYEDVAAFKRREKFEYETLVCKITSVMLEKFVDFIKEEKCIDEITLDEDEICQDDTSKVSLVSSAHTLSVHEDLLSCNTSSQSSGENYFSGPFVHQNSENLLQNLDVIQKSVENKVSEGVLEKIGRLDKIKNNKQINLLKQDDKLEKIKKAELNQRKKILKSQTESKDHLIASDILSETEEFDVNMNVLFKNGNRYEGRLSCYMMEGESTYTWEDGTTFKGTFTDGIAGGLGLIKWPDGSWYDGEIKNNRRHGKGICVFKHNDKPKMCYFGNWKNGRTNGKGMIIYDENNWYDGYWKKGRIDGFGLRQYPSGSRYLGEWKKGMEHGWGTMIWSNQDVYTGFWVNGKMEGKGTYTWKCIKADGFVHPMQNTYIGHWKSGQRHGHGSLLLASGAVIHAFWINGIKNGPGQIICKNGLVIESSYLFKEDKVNKLDCPIMVPFWNTWYCEFLSSYRTGLFYIQPLKNKTEEVQKGGKNEEEEEEKVIEETPEKYNICSNNIPIFAPVESLPLWNFIIKAVCQPIPDLSGEVNYFIRTEDIELLNSEEIWLRKVITNRMADITCLYQHYATIACEKKPPFKACMFRIMLWQMCRDCGLEYTDLNLCQLDNEAGYDSYPFATIPVFQMIHYLLLLAFELCVRKRKSNPSIPGRWGGAFDYFLTNYALPGMQKTNRIPELCNTIPLKNVFSLYENIGIPVTVGKMFDHILSDDDPNVVTEEKPKIKISDKLNGQNKIYPDGRIVYEETNGSLLGTLFDFEEPNTNYFDLYEIKYLGKKELAWNFFNVCPKAREENIPNRDYEVSFLEFCEFIKIALKKYQGFIDPDSEVTLVTKLRKCDLCTKWVEIEDHYEIQHGAKGINEVSGDTETTAEGSSYLNNESKTLSGQSTESTSATESWNADSAITPTFDTEQSQQISESTSIEENSRTKICKCNGSSECLCNFSRNSDNSESYDIVEQHDTISTESSIVSTSIPFKDARTITLTACDSECQCFCHEKFHYFNEENTDEEELEESDFESTDLEKKSFEEESDIDSANNIKLSDAINYLCDKTDQEEEGETEKSLEETFSKEESSNEFSDYSDSEFKQEVEDEQRENWSFEEEDNLLAGEDFIVKTKNFFSDLDRFETLKDNQGAKTIFQKVLEFNFPSFKIKFAEFFRHVSAKGMTPKELKKLLDLDGSEDLFEEQGIEDIKNDIINESLKVVGIVANQRLYEKLLMRQFRNTISTIESGEYWENFVETETCDCTCKKCLSGNCQKVVKKKIKFAVEDELFEFSSDSSVTII